MVPDYDSYTKQPESLRERLARHREVPHFSRFESLLRTFSPGERMVLYIFIALLAVSALAQLARANALVSTNMPVQGGSFTEGVVGSVRFINPLLALSGPDKDLSTLVYSGLMRATPDGSHIPDLAKAYEISQDGTVYTFFLRPDLSFHDGTPLTSADVLFTIQRAQNPDIKSSRRADWEGVSVSAPDPQTVVFTLPHAYAPFLENTTLGILPKHIWESVPADEFPFHPRNTDPIGSGPYKVAKVVTTPTGSAARYELSAFSKFALEKTYLQKITFLFQ
jgi:peptide/nickel transport system substrate-binding protein